MGGWAAVQHCPCPQRGTAQPLLCFWAPFIPSPYKITPVPMDFINCVFAAGFLHFISFFFFFFNLSKPHIYKRRIVLLGLSGCVVPNTVNGEC